MNPVQRLQKAIHFLGLSGDLQTILTKPKYTFGIWHLDVKWGQVWVVYQWSSKLGHGVSLLTDTVGYGEGPEYVFHTLEEAVEKLGDLFDLDDLDRYILDRSVREPEFAKL